MLYTNHNKTLASSSSLDPSSIRSPTKNASHAGNSTSAMDSMSLPEPRMLGTPKLDEQHLNPFHCFLRQEIVELFTITESNIRYYQKYRKQDKIVLGRVGLRCKFCCNFDVPSSNNDEQQRNSKVHAWNQKSYASFPSSLMDIYYQVVAFQRVHLQLCTFISEEMKEKAKVLKEKKKKNGRKQYWKEAAAAIGIVQEEFKVDGDDQHSTGLFYTKKKVDPKLLQDLWDIDTYNTPSVSSTTSNVVASNKKNLRKGSGKKQFIEVIEEDEEDEDEDDNVESLLLPLLAIGNKRKRKIITYEYNSDEHSVDPEECVNIIEYLGITK